MRIAVACDGLSVAPFFVQTTSYMFYTVKQGVIVDSRNLPAFDKTLRELADLLKSLEVDVLVVGSIEPEMAAVIRDAGIELAEGASGEPLTAARACVSEMFALAD